MKMKIKVIVNGLTPSDGTFYYDAVLVEVRYVNFEEWYCYLIHCDDGTTVTFPCGNSAVFLWDEVTNRYEVI